MTLGAGIPVEPSPRETGRHLRLLAEGRLNVTGEVVLANGATSTAIGDRRFSSRTEIVLVPRSATQAALAWWLAAREVGKLTIGHDAPTGDQTFGYIAIG